MTLVVEFLELGIAFCAQPTSFGHFLLPASICRQQRASETQEAATVAITGRYVISMMGDYPLFLGDAVIRRFLYL